jgi:hypothetical protein
MTVALRFVSEAQNTTMRNNEEVHNATEAGKAWAESKADTLEGGMSPEQWPEVWDPRWVADGEVARWARQAGAELIREADFEAFKAAAHNAAGERWSELLSFAREREDVPDDELDQEVEAVKLVALLDQDLPPGLLVDHDGPRVFLLDPAGTERTVVSLPHAWRVIAEWQESRSL